MILKKTQAVSALSLWAYRNKEEDLLKYAERLANASLIEELQEIMGPTCERVLIYRAWWTNIYGLLGNLAYKLYTCMFEIEEKDG